MRVWSELLLWVRHGIKDEIPSLFGTHKLALGGNVALWEVCWSSSTTMHWGQLQPGQLCYQNCQTYDCCMFLILTFSLAFPACAIVQDLGSDPQVDSEHQSHTWHHRLCGALAQATWDLHTKQVPLALKLRQICLPSKDLSLLWSK